MSSSIDTKSSIVDKSYGIISLDLATSIKL